MYGCFGQEKMEFLELLVENLGKGGGGYG